MESIKIFEPPDAWNDDSNLRGYMDWLKANKKLDFEDYGPLWQWSVQHIDDFWKSILEYFEVLYQGSFQEVLSSFQMPGVKWFEGIRLNYAAHLARNKRPDEPAIIACNEAGDQKVIDWTLLLRNAASLQLIYDNAGLHAGDRVVAYLPTIPEASAALLATAASGLVWSSCAPEFGSASVIDRVSQIQPKVLLSIEEYRYGGKTFDRKQELMEIIAALPSLEIIILVQASDSIEKTIQDKKVYHWEELMTRGSLHTLRYELLPFDHPLWILYSSGTTGLPKAITHSHGGMLLEHLKYTHFHNEVRPGDLFFWYTTTGWMMWNFLHATWLAGSTIVLFDGHPAYPNAKVLWELADQLGIHHFGCGAPYIHQTMKENQMLPALPLLKSINSTGSPLSAAAFQWMYRQVNHPFYLWSMSGGTDMCTAFVGGCPIWPIYLGEIQCRALGCDLKVLDQEGNELMGEVGEMVIAKPMPCMPIYFWNDPGQIKYQEAYFEQYPGLWRHGDWIELTPRHGLIISGRSDTTLKRYGVRIGTAEIYAAIQTVSILDDSLIIHVEQNGSTYMPLFVKLKPGLILDEKWVTEIKSVIKTKCSPRHVPDQVVQVADIPYTLSGKKMETAVKKIFMGTTIHQVVSLGAMRNPDCLNEYMVIARQRLRLKL